MYCGGGSGGLWQAVAMRERWECRRSDGVLAVVVVGQGLAPEF
jgi:hypothetical protein